MKPRGRKTAAATSFIPETDTLSQTAGLIAAALAAVLAASPAFGGLFDDEEARRKIGLHQQQLEKLQTQNQTLEGRLANLEETAKSGTGTLELLSQIEALTQEVRQLRGRIEEQGHQLEAAAKRQKDFYVDLDSRLRRLEQAAAASPPSAPAAPPTSSTAPGASGATPPAATPPSTTPPASSPTGPGSDATSATPRSAAEPKLPPSPRWVGKGPAPDQAAGAETRSYEGAYELFKTGNYQGAVGSFGQFLKTYPKSPLAPSAQYWIGNSYYAARDYRNAISSQQKLLAAYPESQKVPDAWLNIASSQIELGEAVAAKKTLQELLTKYPESEAADKAKKRLASLK